MKKQYTAPSIKMRAIESETGFLSASDMGAKEGPTNLSEDAPDWGGYGDNLSAGSKSNLWDEE